MTADPAAVVRAFIEAINSGSPGRWAAMMTESHLFVGCRGGHGPRHRQGH